MPIFTLFFKSEFFFSLKVLLSISYIAFSSLLVKITVLPLCSNKLCTFSAIFKLVSASVVPLELCAPSSGTPCPASITITLPLTGNDTVSIVSLLLAILKEKAKGANIEFTGYKEWPEIKEIVGKARFSVVPSEWYENNPLSVIEAQCLGTPVLGANIGGIPELIKEGVNGMCFESRNIMDLKNKIEKMFILNVDYKQLAKSSQIRYSSEKHYNELLELYQR